jgi:hypothetical protein
MDESVGVDETYLKKEYGLKFSGLEAIFAHD